MSFTIAVASLKAGTGKTTCAVWLARAFAETGCGVLLADADPALTALQWARAAGRCPFRVTGLAAADLPATITALARSSDVVIIDTPWAGDHAPITRLALRAADQVLIPCAPTPPEVARTAALQTRLPSQATAPGQAAVLLNRCVTHARSTAWARQTLTGLGYHVLAATVPRLELYAQSLAGPLPATGAAVWRNIARELLARAQLLVNPGSCLLPVGRLGSATMPPRNAA